MNREQVLEMYKTGKSTDEISKLTDIPKPTVYRWIKKAGINRSISESRIGIKLSEEHKQSISKSLKGKYMGEDRWTTKQLKNGWNDITPELAYIVGVMMGDGTLTKSTIKLEVIDEDFADEFRRTCEIQFGVECQRYEYEPRKINNLPGGEFLQSQTYITCLNSILVAEFIKNVKNEKWINFLNREQKISWLRGVWDSEGSITEYNPDKNYSYLAWNLKFQVKDKMFCELFYKILKEFIVINTVISKSITGKYSVSINKRNNIIEFFSIIQPTIQRKRAIFERCIEYDKERKEK